jgi:hypothetical protein
MIRYWWSLGNVHRHIIRSTFPILCCRRRRTVKRARSLHAAAGGARLAHRNFAAHCSNIERPGSGAFARAHSCGQSAQGRGRRLRRYGPSFARVAARTRAPRTLPTTARKRSSDWAAAVAAGDFGVSHRRPV